MPQPDRDELQCRRWQAAFERCDRDICCPAATWHRPLCPRRAERLARDFERPNRDLDPNLTRPAPRPPLRMVPETRDEMGRHGCLWMLIGVALVTALAMASSWWVVYG